MTSEIQKSVGKMQVLKGHMAISNFTFLSEMDVCSISPSNMVYEFEVKISRSDFLADKKKSKWSAAPIEKYYPNYFSYCCPTDLINASEIQDFAGLYYFESGEISEIKKPKNLHRNEFVKEKFMRKFMALYSQRAFLGGALLSYKNKESKRIYN